MDRAVLGVSASNFVCGSWQACLYCDLIASRSDTLPVAVGSILILLVGANIETAL
jgi:hypothetical protein